MSNIYLLTGGDAFETMVIYYLCPLREQGGYIVLLPKLENSRLRARDLLCLKIMEMVKHKNIHCCYIKYV
jgi:hypothetical protein